MVLSYEARIAFDTTLVGSCFLLVLLRVWIKNRYRTPNLKFEWILSDIFIVIAVCISGVVIGLDSWILVERIKLRDDHTSSIAEKQLMVTKIQVDFYKVLVPAVL